MKIMGSNGVLFCICILFTFLQSLDAHALEQIRARKQPSVRRMKQVGTWGPWNESSQCSRSCGGGITLQERICADGRAGKNHSCVGSSRRYSLCNTKDCPPSSKDFRDEQCARLNSVPYKNKYHKWVPYLGASNPCKLYCSPEKKKFSISVTNVIDGTRCRDDGTLDVCVDGKCMLVGCDYILGSHTKMDMCGVCGGNGSTCDPIMGKRGKIDTSNKFDCDQIPEKGPCKHLKPHFYYDQKQGICKSFTIGGCRWDKNIFQSEHDCYKKCRDTLNNTDCVKHPKTKLCITQRLRFYYDEEEDKCKSFNYGGCKESKNNFISKDACYKRCGRCGVDQKYYSCKPNCENRCNRPKKCNGVCHPGCFCRPGLFLRDDNKCVRKKLCGGDPPGTHITCSAKKEYYECYSRRNNSCELYGGDQEVWPEKCERGCFCKRGLLVDSKGRCVEPGECKVCGKNERMVGCAKPKACNTCNNRGHCDLKNCTRGCDCIPGYYRDEIGVCIPESQCPQHEEDPEDCGPNKIYSDCGSACPLTCDDHDKSIMCTLDCRIGCFCKHGFVLNAKGVCVLPSECITDCGPNQVYSDCGSSCPLTCDDHDKSIPCTLDCRIGCFCKQGFVLNDKGVCVSPAECPRVCGKNEEVVDCAKPKDCNTCNIRGNCNNLNCSKDCDCIPGYYRDGSGVCIPESECPQYKRDPKDCGPNEVYKDCGSTCQATCDTDLSICSYLCKRGCFCKEDLVRNAEGVCIPRSECPRGRRRNTATGLQPSGQSLSSARDLFGRKR